MAEYRSTDANGNPVYVEKRGGGLGRTLAILLILGLVLVGIGFATGFFRMSATGGALPKAEVNVKGGALPDVDLDSKKVVVGTKESTVEVPKVTTEKEKIDVPVIGVSEGETDGKK